MNQYPHDWHDRGQPIRQKRLKPMGQGLAPIDKDPVHVQLRRLSKRSAIFCLKSFLVLSVLSVFFLGAAYIWISQNPVSLSFLVKPIETSISRELDGLFVKIDDAVVQRHEKGYGIVFRLKNVRIQDPNQTTVAQAPSAAISLSLPALFTGRIAPASVDFIGPSLRLIKSPDGNLRVAFSNAPTQNLSDLGEQTEAQSENAADVPVLGAQNQKERILSQQIGQTIAEAHAKQVDLVQALFKTLNSARDSQATSSYLSSFGMRNAAVVVNAEDKDSLWRIPDVKVTLTHHNTHTAINVNANIKTPSETSKLKLRIEQQQNNKNLLLTSEISDLRPTSLSYYFPDVKFFQAMDIPISGEAQLQLSQTGEWLSANTNLLLGTGKIGVSWNEDKGLQVDSGQLQLTYSKDDGLIKILPSSLKWGESQAMIDGELRTVVDQNGVEFWQFFVQAQDAKLSSEEFGIQAMPVENWNANGFINANQGRIILENFQMNIAGASVKFKGEILDGPGSPAILLNGQLGAMPVSIFKQIWPRFVAPGARDWVGERVPDGQIFGGNVAINIPVGMLAAAGNKVQNIPDNAVQFDLDIQNATVHYVPGLAPINAQKAKASITGQSFTLKIPDAEIRLPSGDTLALSTGKFTIPDLRDDPPYGEIEFKLKSKAHAVLEFLDQEPLGYLKEVNFNSSMLSGNAGGFVKIGLPLLKDVKFSDLKIDGKIKLTKAELQQNSQDFSIKDGNLDFGVTEKSVHASGQIKLNGVSARIDWHRIFKAAENKQPPVRLSANLSPKDFEKIGIPISHVVKGKIPTTVTMLNGFGTNLNLHVQANLDFAAIDLRGIGFRKAKGRRAQLEFDVRQSANKETQLKNFKLVGEDLAINGEMLIDKNGKLTEFAFPDISMNVITRLAASGKRATNNIWEVDINGPSMDARELFRSFFSGGPAGQVPKEKKKDVDLQISAKVDTMIGFGGAKLNNFKLFMKRENGKLTALDGRGAFNKDKNLAVTLRNQQKSQRVLLAETNDAGNAFKLIGFYPNVVGGDASFAINLDAQGAVEKSGTLWARNFSILGDKVVQQVLTSSNDEVAGFVDDQPRRRRASGQILRERIPFDQLKIPFSVGQGQFILHHAFINGPALRAKLAGKIDFEREIIDLGGTYIPLPGLSDIFQGIPIVNIFVGNGLWGVTFAVQGKLDQPEVIVNPASMLAPGIFREMFRYDGATQQINPREDDSQQQFAPAN